MGVCIIAMLVFAKTHRKAARVARAEAALRRREESFALALQGSNDGLWHWNLLTDTTHYSSRVTELLSYGPNELERTIGAFLDLMHPEDRLEVQQLFQLRILDDTPYDTEIRMRLKSGDYRWFRARGRIERDDAGEAVQMAGSITDISDRRHAEAASTRHSMQQSLIAELGQVALNDSTIGEIMNHALVVIERGLPAQFYRLLVADADDTTLVLAGGSGWDAEWLSHRTYNAVEETEDRFIVGVREAVLIDDYHSETRFKPSTILRAHGVRSGVEMLICGAQSSHGVLAVYSRERGQFTWENVNFLRSIANILAASMDRKIADERLTYMAQFDALTGLPNRNMFIDRLWHAIAESEHDQRRAGVIFVDLDRFKLVNDTLGHSAGDELLLQVAQRLLACMRTDDLVGRLGGDEFGVAILNLTDSSDAQSVAQTILNAMTKPFELAGQEIYISASLGIAIHPTDGRDPDTLLRNADTAMYCGKESGGNSYELYVPQMNERAVERLRLETDLRGALERDEFLLHYQPKASFASGEICGFEALLRWQHPQRGLVPPGVFISILEETGMIVAVGEWVLITVCRQLHAWRTAGVPLYPVAVNLSPRQFSQADLDGMVREILRSTGVDPSLLELELTESMLMTDSEAAVKILSSLKTSGVRLSVDDFGTGYSSLAYLKRFPLDALKIDRTFIRDVCTDADGSTIVLAIINLAHSLKLKVVAEGVETVGQLHLLKMHGCDEMQGYYFARPQPAATCTQFLLEGWALPHQSNVQWLARTAP